MMLEESRSSDLAASEEALADALRLVIGRIARRLRQQSLGEMTPSQRSVLASLERHGSLRMGELARIENISAPSLSGIVGRLEARGFITRTGDPGDARSTIVEVTPLAVEALAEARAERNAFLHRRLSTLSREEREVVASAVALLEKIAEER
jgi:DNA-binding MarR family transcriptional regulator